MKYSIFIVPCVFVFMTCTDKAASDQGGTTGLRETSVSQEDSILEVFSGVNAIEYPVDTAGISINLMLDIVSVPKENKYPLGLGLRYRFTNNTDDKLFINFQPVFVTATKDGRRSFFLNKASVKIDMVQPSAVRNAVIQMPCASRPSKDLSEKLSKTIDDDENANYPGKDSFVNSFLFLDPHESFECVENMSGLLSKTETDTFNFNGMFRFYMIFDSSRDSVFFQHRVPNEFEGYKRYKGKAVSNQIFLNIR